MNKKTRLLYETICLKREHQGKIAQVHPNSRRLKIYIEALDWVIVLFQAEFPELREQSAE